MWAMPLDVKTGTANGDRVRITNGPDHKPVMDASADGKKILFLRTNIQPAVYVAQIDAKTKSVGWPERLTLDDRKNLPYEWTPDGKSVLYISNREGKFHVYRQAVGQGAPELVATGVDEPNILRLNPERTEILYTTLKKGDAAAQHLPKDDSKDAAMQANKEAGNGQSVEVFRIMRVPLAGGQPKQLLEWPQINNLQCARMAFAGVHFHQLREPGAGIL